MIMHKSYLRLQYSFKTKYTIGQVTCKMSTLCLGQICIVTKPASAIILAGMTGQKSKCDAPSNSTAKNRCFAKLLKIVSPLKNGQGFALSDLRDNVNGYSDSTETFSNIDI